MCAKAKQNQLRMIKLNDMITKQSHLRQSNYKR